ncbi:hypothetical protein [Streptomyces triticirhizae]|uniref:Uncharacterized protein n=1 Tax=Streptomyces triticirhizae TaxID=2483353 RepID=A0A3M2LV97_9ACTN|nr:hypothetical protein [Streptomyces triticirhizae]RMI41434.1 hypothetical protein EBN88_10950 [Streptomyces triticirhizae]
MLLVVLYLLYQLVASCANFLENLPSEESTESRAVETREPCPARIDAELPGVSAELVDAFRTDNKQITLCRTGEGELYYFGEYSDGREPGIPMRARESTGGYEASNGPYRYEISNGVVTIYEDGARIGQEELTPEPDPT